MNNVQYKNRLCIRNCSQNYGIKFEVYVDKKFIKMSCARQTKCFKDYGQIQCANNEPIEKFQIAKELNYFGIYFLYFLKFSHCLQSLFAPFIMNTDQK